MSSFADDDPAPLPRSHADDEAFDPPSYRRPKRKPPPRAPREIVEDRLTVELRRRHDGWTAERQRIFLNTLANTGRITGAAEMADITPRSAYRLRKHPQSAAFAKAWDAAMMRASGRLLGVAMERAIAGTPQVTWCEGCIVAQTAPPSDRMLMFLLRHLHPALFDSRDAANVRAYHLAASARNFGPAMEAITDTDVEADLIDIDDYRPHPPPENIREATCVGVTFVTFRAQRRRRTGTWKSAGLSAIHARKRAMSGCARSTAGSA